MRAKSKIKAEKRARKERLREFTRAISNDVRDRGEMRRVIDLRAVAHINNDRAWGRKHGTAEMLHFYSSIQRAFPRETRAYGIKFVKDIYEAALKRMNELAT